MQHSELPGPIEAYFAAMEAPLRDVPLPRRQEFLAEARAHLHAMVEARRADGLDENAAWQSAIKEFGEANEVGRALWKQWANGVQLESEGEPLSKRELVKRHGWRLVAALGVYGLLTLLQKLDPPWATPFLIGSGALCFGFGTYRSRRQGMQWTPSNIAATVFCVVQLLLILAQLQWAQVRLFTWGTFGMLGCWLFWWWLYKRDLRNRPWQSAPVYKQNPVVAEQTYRIGPLLGWIMGSVMGCIGTVTTGLQFFGWTHTLISLAVWILFDVAVGFYLWKRR